MSAKLVKNTYLNILIEYMKNKNITTKLAVNVNSIHRDTGISYNTTKKYVEYILDNQLIDWKKGKEKDESTHKE